MKTVLCYSLLFIISYGSSLHGQDIVDLRGNVIDSEDKSPLVGVNIVSQKMSTSSDKDGYYSLSLPAGRTIITFSHIGYETKEVDVNTPDLASAVLNIELSKKPVKLNIVVVSGSAQEKKIEEETVSIDIIRPYLISSNNITDMSAAVEKVPGVKIIDGQISIRNGAGWAYSLGSRVQVLVDGQSYLSAGVGDVRWGFLPTDIKQVEVIKGASSVLYGNSSMNGVVNIITEWPSEIPRTSFSVYSGYFDEPERNRTAWWSENRKLFQVPKKQDLIDSPFYNGFSLQHKRRFGKNLDLVIGSRMNNKHSYLKFVDEYRMGLNAKTRYRDQKIDGLIYGINTNIMHEVNDRFFFFKEPDSSYIPFGDTDNPLVYEETYDSYSITPYIVYITSHGGKHKLSGSYFGVIQQYEGTSLPSNKFGATYQFQKNWKNDISLTSGIDMSYGGIINTNLFGDLEPYTMSNAIFSQVESKIGNLLISFGIRNENYEIQNIPLDDIDSVLYNPTSLIPHYDIEYGGLLFPIDTIIYDLQSSFKANSGMVKRIGLNYPINSGLFFRASYGEGFRLPSLLERYMKNYNNNDFLIAQNPVLHSESGWTSELGLKQIVPFVDGIGYFDIALFWMEYNDYIELNFSRTYIPEKDSVEFGTQSMNDGMKTIYRTENIGDVRITGLEVSATGELTIWEIPIRFTGGYTFTYPGDLFNIINSGCNLSEITQDPLDDLNNRVCLENAPNNTRSTYWELLWDSMDGLDDEPWVDQNNNDYFDEGDIFIDENEDGYFNNESINLLPYRHRHIARFDIEAEYKDITAGISLEYNSGIERVDWYMENWVGNLNQMRKFKYHEPYIIINGRISYSFLTNSKITLVVKNATNIEYAHRIGYMGAPMSFVLQYNLNI